MFIRPKGLRLFPLRDPQPDAEKSLEDDHQALPCQKVKETKGEIEELRGTWMVSILHRQTPNILKPYIVPREPPDP